MARPKKHTLDTYRLPSLFDDNQLLGLAPEPTPSIAGLERHIQVAKSAMKQKAASVSPMGNLNRSERVLFISFGSGSSGNCTYVGTQTQGVLIDAGVDDRKVEAEMVRNGLSMDVVKGILLTHDHGDHVRYAYSMLRRFRHLALYCTPRVLNGILRRHNVSRRIKDYHHAIYKEIEFSLGGFTITAFEVDHDGSDNAGYYITCPGFDFTVATDLGKIGARADYYMRRASYLMIESNYDLEMLRHGRYPEYLKARIMADNGHLDNRVTAAYVASIYRPELKYVFLCHLSHDNNTPQKAVEAISNSMAACGITIGDGSNSPTSLQAPLQVIALPRYESTGIITLHIPGRNEDTK